MTIKDVAKEAGVSVATVSRVLNTPDSVSDSTREIVNRAIEKTGYMPNILGKHLRCNKTNIILVMLTTIANSFCAKVIHSIDNEAKKHGYSLMICATNNDVKTEKRYIGYLKNRLVDGIIIINSIMNHTQMSNLSSYFPVVQCSEYVDKKTTPFISIDNKKAAYDAVTHLISNGKKRILFIGVDNNLVSSRHRLSGYKKALEDNSIEFDQNLIIYGNYGYRNAMSIMNDFMKTNNDFDAVFAISDKMAAGAITALINNEKKVPDDIMVVGFDNTDVSYIYNPTLTTISQPHKEMGRLALDMVIKKINNENCDNIILDHELVIRDSTNKLKIIKKEMQK